MFGICQTKAWDNGKYSLVECLFSIKSYPYRRQSCETRWRNYARASFKFRHDNRWSLNDGPKRNTSLTLLLIQLNGWTIRSALLVDSTRIQFFLFFFFCQLKRTFRISWKSTISVILCSTKILFFKIWL